MYIELIKIEGFKSFADKIELPLTKYLNIIIGPNGSGKSNIIDAISFLLGESSRNLRADKGTNLIYNGVKNVNEAYVEVIVNLENEKIKELEELNENKDGKVYLRRRIKKNGESSYYVNNSRVTKSYFERILTILKLNSPYNIIFQGDITNVVKSSGKERRKIFEDLAQISVFEERKNKVLKDLEKVEIKLSEFKAILLEKEKRVNELKKEKELAEKFLELQKKKNSLLKAKLINKIKKIEEKFNELNNLELTIETKLKENKKLKEEIELKIREINEEIEKINKKIKEEGGEEINKLEEELREKFRKIESLKVKLEMKEKELLELEQFKEKIVNEKEEIRKKIFDLEKEKSFLLSEYKKLKEELNNYSSDLLDDKELEKLEKEIEEIKNKLFYLKNEKLFKEHKINEIKKLIGVGEEFDLNNLENELKNLLLKDSQLSSKINTLKQIVKEKENKLFKLKGEYEEIIKQIKSNKLFKRILDLKEEIEGLYGPLFMLMELEDKYKEAIEIAGGNRLKAIVVENEDVAKKVIDIIKKEKLGIVSFIPLNRIKERYLTHNNEEGIIGVAVDLINFDPKFRKAFYYVFGDTLVIENFDTAKKIGIGKYRMVTLNGELFETSGIITGGSLKKGISFFDPNLENKINLLEGEINQYKNQIEELKKEREQLSEKIFNLRIKKKEIETKEKEIKSLKEYEKQLNELNEKIKEMEKLLSEKEKEYKEKSSKYKELINVLKEREKLINKIKEFENQINLINEKISNFLTNMKEKERVFFSLVEKIEQTNKELEKLIKEKEIEEEKIKEIEKILNSVKGKVKELIEKKDLFYEKYSEENKKLLKIEEEIQKLDKQLYEIELKKRILEDERVKLIKEKEEIKEEPLFMENLDSELENITKKLRAIGSVNLKVLDVFDEVNKEYLEFKRKVEEIVNEKERIINVLTEIEDAKTKEFYKVFNEVNNNFQRIYKEMVEKGRAWLEITNKTNPFEGGIEIIVEINNKKFNLKSLSGGEQTLVALSLIFAIQEFRKGTFYAFDEIDASLDKRNARKLAKYLKKYSKRTQFIVISHNEEVIVEADYLFGVNMNKKTGISKIVALDLKNLDNKKEKVKV